MEENMMKKTFKMMLLFLLLLSLLVGIASATDMSSDNAKHNIQKQVSSPEKILTKDSSKTSKIKTKLTVKKIKNTQYSKNTTISGKYTDIKGKKLKNTLIRLKINNKNYTTKTDNKGVYSFNYKARTPGKNNVIISHPGNSKYIGSTIKSTFNVTSKKTMINLNKVSNTYYNSPTTISGYYYDSDKKPLKNTLLTIRTNNKNHTTKTDDKGYFNYKYYAKKTGTNNIIVSYDGNAKFNGALNKTSFSAKINPTKIILNNIHNTSYKKNVTVSGKYLDIQNKALMNTLLRVNINGKNYTVKTDDKGVFRREFKATLPGKNTAIVSYPGNINYGRARASTSFKVNPMKTKIQFNFPDKKIKPGAYLRIKGKFMDEEGFGLRNSNIKTNTYLTLTTDENGKFDETLYLDTPGDNILTLSYEGNDKYASTTSEKLYHVEKANSLVYIDPINSMKVGKTVTIKGGVLAVNQHGNEVYMELTDMPVTLNVDGESDVLKTKTEYTRFTFKVEAKSVGTHNITVTCLGNDQCFKSTETGTFYVYDKTESFMSIPYTEDFYDAGYEKYMMFTTKLNKTHKRTTIGTSEITAPVHKILKFKLYLKNKYGNVITKTKTLEYDSEYVDYDSSYSPYKVDLTMRELSDKEREELTAT